MPTTFEALAVVIVAVVPGTLARAAWARGKTFEGPTSDAAALVQAIVLSLVIQAVLAPATFALFFDERNQLDRVGVRLVAWGFIAVIVVPVAGGYLVGLVSEWVARRETNASAPVRRRLVRDLAPVPPSAFDWLVGRGRVPDPGVIVVMFRDGSRLAGVYAEGAALVTSPQRQGLYLPVEISLDTDGEPTGQPLPHSMGLVIPDLTEVRSLRILSL